MPCDRTFVDAQHCSKCGRIAAAKQPAVSTAERAVIDAAISWRKNMSLDCGSACRCPMRLLAEALDALPELRSKGDVDGA